MVYSSRMGIPMNNEDKAPKDVSISDMEVQYLLKELEIQFSIEAKARDRAEQMLQYLLTSIAAIIGAVLFLLPSMGSPIPIVFLAMLLIFVFGVSSFYRTCRLRNIITQTRLTRYLIRDALYQGKVKQARLLMNTDKDLTGFSEAIVRNLSVIALVCSLFGALVFALTGILLIQELIGVSLSQLNDWILPGILAVVGFLVTFTALRLILRNYQRIAVRLQETYSITQDKAEIH